MKQKHLLILNIVLSAAIMLASCTDTTGHGSDTDMKIYFKDLLKNVDKVQVQYFHAGDTLTRTLTQKDRIDIYKELINGKQDRRLKCDTTGRLLFFIKDTLRLDAYFSTPATGSKYNTGVVEYFLKPDVYKTLFTYRAGMSVDEYFYEFIKQKSDTTQNNR
jgi:predicted small secreted protein